MQTTRERIADQLRTAECTPSEIAAAVDVPVDDVLEHLEHVAASVEGADERVTVRPPRCRACGYDDFDELLNVPSRCPRCRAERIAEPVLRVE